MAPRIKTRERIVQTSLELFNQQGERSVSTNHIAAHMEISPGNLYYHFPNKQAIIAELFLAYEALAEGFLQLPAGRPLTVADMRDYLLAILDGMWRYRFLHRDLEHLLSMDADLATRYRRFSKRSLSRAMAIYAGFNEAGVLALGRSELESLTLNTWIILTSWVRFLSTLREMTRLEQAAVRRGVYQVLMLAAPYVTPQSQEEFKTLCDGFTGALDEVLD